MKAKKRKQLYFYIPFFLILTISLFVMYHAKFISPLYEKNLLKQSIFFLAGIILLLFHNKIKIKWLFDYSFWIYLFNLFLLILVLLIGSTTKGAKAWFHLGFFSFQPSELMKLSLCLYLSHFSSKQELKTKFSQIIYLFKAFLITIIPSILVFLEPDTGAILYFFIIAIAIVFKTKISKKWFLLLIFLFSFLTGTFCYLYYEKQDLLIQLIGTSFFYRVERILNFQKGLQITNALTAIGSAPFFLWNLNENRIYIPEAPTDFAFTLTANTFGIFGILIVLLCYFLIDIYLLNLWKESKNQKSNYFCSGFICMFFVNQFQNILMNIGMIPIMGIPLPFLSYGGSTTIVYFLFLFILFKKENHN